MWCACAWRGWVGFRSTLTLDDPVSKMTLKSCGGVPSPISPKYWAFSKFLITTCKWAYGELDEYVRRYVFRSYRDAGQRNNPHDRHPPPARPTRHQPTHRRTFMFEHMWVEMMGGWVDERVWCAASSISGMLDREGDKCRA